GPPRPGAGAPRCRARAGRRGRRARPSPGQDARRTPPSARNEPPPTNPDTKQSPRTRCRLDKQREEPAMPLPPTLCAAYPDLWRSQAWADRPALIDARGETTPSYGQLHEDRKSTRLNSSHVKNSYAVLWLKK